MNNLANQAYGRFEGTVELPAQLTLGVAPTETKFPWKWFIIGGLVIGFIIYIAQK